MITSYESFIAGVQVGRRMKVWDAERKINAQIESSNSNPDDESLPDVDENDGSVDAQDE